MNNFSRESKIITYYQVEILKLKNIITEFKNLIYGFNSRLDTKVKKIRIKHRKKKLYTKEHKRYMVKRPNIMSLECKKLGEREWVRSNIWRAIAKIFPKFTRPQVGRFKNCFISQVG